MAKNSVKETAPAGPTPTVTVRMPQTLRDFVEDRAIADDRTFSNMLIKIVTDWAKSKGFKG